ncbi:MAG: hypothetical protein JKP90_17480 [Desulfofustis sp. PB-SRB1]|nr:hypothetical protein [Desulfofustis sp. PB-SRB1]
MTARNSMQHHLTPDGTSVAHGLLSTTAEDFARFGMLFTPSWNKGRDETGGLGAGPETSADRR